MSKGVKLSGGFWRRVFAALIDLVLISALVTGLAIGLHQLSGGYIRLAQPIIGGKHCNSQPGAPAGITIPYGIRPDTSTTCVTRMFGVEVDRSLRINQRDVAGSGQLTAQSNRFFDIPLDANDRPTPAYYVDWLNGVLLVVTLALTEASLATTPGKALLGLKVRSAGRRPNLLATLMRNFLLWGYYPLGSLTNWIAEQVTNFGIAGYWTTHSALLVIEAVWAVGTVAALLFMRPSPFWDRWTGTQVERANALSPSI